jgi:hypothetical protein
MLVLLAVMPNVVSVVPIVAYADVISHLRSTFKRGSCRPDDRIWASLRFLFKRTSLRADRPQPEHLTLCNQPSEPRSSLAKIRVNDIGERCTDRDARRVIGRDRTDGHFEQIDLCSVQTVLPFCNPTSRRLVET